MVLRSFSPEHQLMYFLLLMQNFNQCNEAQNVVFFLFLRLKKIHQLVLWAKTPQNHNMKITKLKEILKSVTTYAIFF